MRILVTNDDGVGAPGLIELAYALDGEGYDVMVVAPLTDHSGCGTAVSPLHRDPFLSYEEVSVAGLGHVPFYGVDGSPATAVLAACLGGFGLPPRLVVSGINAGLNTASAVLHSGTVGAALTAARLRRPAVAVSLDLPAPNGTGPRPPQWATAAAVAVSAVEWLLAESPDAVDDAPVAFNINVPDRPLSRLRGVVNTIPEPPGPSNAAFVADGRGRLRLETWPRDDEPRPGTDNAAVAAGYAALSSLGGSTASRAFDGDRLSQSLRETMIRVVRRRDRPRCLDRAG